MHAETNSMLFAGIERCIGATMYIDLIPCTSCSKSIIQCGIVRVVYLSEYSIQNNFSVIKLLKGANIQVEKINCNKLGVSY
ncbi:hypothetical protein FG379_002102 [Cryptosporidium bovis]|uniref:uncharacterized protein n=1 Tax=Cryptosporidium bovis TaxID=310047 RepID=UPI00351A1DB6|nr:hypothetical protein FG379_002102 [Cryptosporidium bovis]